MLYKYDEKYDGVRVTADNCKTITGYNTIELIRLTGLFGCGLINIPISYKISNFYPVPMISVECSELKMIRSINLKHRFIYNERFEVTTAGNGFGWKAIKSQVEAAEMAGLKEIKVRAYGSYAEKDEYNGYITWGKVGFTMYEAAQKKFENHLRVYETLLRDKKIFDVKVLHDLLRTKAGTEIWEKIGFTWYGGFDLNSHSVNNQILSEYVKKKSKT